MTIAAFATSGTQFPVLDGLLGVSLIIHTHIGVRYGCLVPSTVFPHNVFSV